MEGLSQYRVPLDQLRWSCQTERGSICATDNIEPCGEIIGQERAIDAIKLGLRLEQPGYNVFVVGYSGTGRTTTIQKMLQELGLEDGRPPDDLCYVNNFENPDCPRALRFPAGMGMKFRAEMDRMIKHLREAIPGLMESEQLRTKRKTIAEEFENKQKEMLRSFEKKVKEKEFAMTQVQIGTSVRPDISPVIGGTPTSVAELEAKTEAGEFPKERFDEIRKTYDELAEEMIQLFKQTRQNQKELQQRLEHLHRDAVGPLVYEEIAGLKSEFKAEGLDNYLTEVHDSIIKGLKNFQRGREGEEGDLHDAPPASTPGDPFLEYSVNVVVDNTKTQGKPIVTEVNPNYKNLFGSIERVVDHRGFWRTDFTKIKSGALHRANGGYLILNAMDTLTEAGVWPALKRTLRSGKLEIQAYDPVFMFSQSALKPESVPLNLQVIMIGMPDLYYMLNRMDPDFPKIFKVKADFDTVMEFNKTNLGKYNAFGRKMVEDFGLSPFDEGGMGALVEYGIRLAGRKNKLSTRFNVIADVMREASFWAKEDGSGTVSEQHVDKAVDEWIRRVSLPEDKIGELIDRGTILIDTTGAVVGQINGLSVYDMGEYRFGKPTRITARTSVGAKGIINVEKEAQLSGATHSKGVLIISGYLQGKFAQNRPLSMNAHLCFEQSYGGVDGDSASSTEIYAILSALSAVPIRQDIAVTGSVNQNGTIQAIGGVNEKVEGFFKVCRARGLTGSQGVMIPQSNVPDLMLRREVVSAVEDGKFHIFAVAGIEEGIEILTGMKAGQPNEDGTYPEGTLFHLVEEKLNKYAEAYLKYSSSAYRGMPDGQ